MVDTRYAKLLEPGQIGKVKTRNRIYKSGAGMMMWHEEETHMNPITLAFYEAVARGGAAVVTVESPDLQYPIAARYRNRYRIDDDKFIPGMSELTAVIHKHNALAFMQMEHEGPWQSPLFNNAPATFEGPPIGASAVNVNSKGDFHRDLIRPLTIPEIKNITEIIIEDSVRAKKAGFDGIDINAGSSHLFHNFLSPFWNRRDDEYGGSVEKRAKLLTDIIKGIKQRCGTDYPIVVCINGFEIGRTIGYNDSKCLTVADSRAGARLIVEAGADALMIRNHWLGYHVGGFLPDYLFFPEAPIPLKEMPQEYYWKQKGAGANMLLAEGLKKTVSVPIIVIGYIGPELGEQILKEGKADFIGMHRSLMCDPELPNKLAEGRRSEIAPCTHCGTCLDQSKEFLRHCRVNAAIGTQYFNIEKASRKKKVVVIGGGPAGLEAARVSALRGHDVTLFEKTKNLGGLVPLASLIKGQQPENLPDLIDYLKGQVVKLGVQVRLGQEVDAATIEKLKPDVVFVATGGILTTANIKGIENSNVMTTPALHKKVKPFLNLFGPRMLARLTKFYLPIGKKVIVIGAGLHGTETAEFLIKRGRMVTIVEPTDVIGEGVLDFRLGLLMDWFTRKKINIITGAKDMEITAEGLSFTTKDGKKQILIADTIIPTAPLKGDDKLTKSLIGKVPEVYAIGDGKEPRMIVDAIREGYHTARTI
jgi:2,4-dienoyl-CoA reductase (NADPH2)